jgi:hypothetical protein
MTLPSFVTNWVGSGLSMLECGELVRSPMRLLGDFDLATLFPIPVPAIEWFRPLSREPNELRSLPRTTSAIALGITFFPACVFRLGTTGPPGLLCRYPENWYCEVGPKPGALGPKSAGRDAASDRLRCCWLFAIAALWFPSIGEVCALLVEA